MSVEGRERTSGEVMARRLAREAYASKMGVRLMAEESVRHMTQVTLGYDVPHFAHRGEVIWEARVMAFFDRELRAILWVNPRSETVHFVCGPWDAELTE